MVKFVSPKKPKDIDQFIFERRKQPLETDSTSMPTVCACASLAVKELLFGGAEHSVCAHVGICLHRLVNIHRLRVLTCHGDPAENVSACTCSILGTQCVKRVLSVGGFLREHKDTHVNKNRGWFFLTCIPNNSATFNMVI